MATDLADEMKPVWPSELIPAEHFLFMRVHRVDIDDDGEPFPRAFRNQPKESAAMSTDWEQYASASETRRRGPKAPEEYVIVKFTAGAASSIPGQMVNHDPLFDNRAHTLVFGEKNGTEVRERFMQIYTIEIPLLPFP